MATHGTLDVVVHLHRFRNVDLFSRGIYMVRAAVKCNSKQVIPHGCYSKPPCCLLCKDQEILNACERPTRRASRRFVVGV